MSGAAQSADGTIGAGGRVNDSVCAHPAATTTIEQHVADAIRARTRADVTW